MPVPANIVWGAQRFALDRNFHAVLNDRPVSRAYFGIERFLRRLDNRTHLMIGKSPYITVSAPKGPRLNIEYSRIGQLIPGEDESYTLTVTGDMVQLSAVTDLGILHGLETFLQLLEHEASGYFLRGVTIHDQPRFTWRGLMIDVCRHFSPVDVIKRNIDAMVSVKINVLHLHLSEDQGFRIESKVFPLLHMVGNNGEYYTQAEIRDIIQYATDRGIRVIPEFDMPGHATAWFVGYPELASAPGSYEVEKKFGVFDPTMDPTRKGTYKFLKKFLAEMCALFPDPYFHIGGDENNGKQWDGNPEIQEFMKKRGIKNNHELQAYFNRKLLDILQKNGKKMVGWDEILAPSIPVDCVIQSWRGKEGLRDATTKGYPVILSNGYYIDLMYTAQKHYMNDPVPGDLNMTHEQEQLVLGGEATMWAELVTVNNIDSRIWPRTAAIAERLWSPAAVNDVSDMYRRLEIISFELEEHGLNHLSYQEMMLHQLAPGKDVTSLEYLASWIEPLKDYQRQNQGLPYSTDLPFTRMPDIAKPESDLARKFAMQCERLIKHRDSLVADSLFETMMSWEKNHERVLAATQNIPALTDWTLRSQQLSDLASIGMKSLEFIRSRSAVQDSWVSESSKKIKEIQKPVQESELAVTGSILMLFQYALPK